jgi:hypothetical protein
MEYFQLVIGLSGFISIILMQSYLHLHLALEDLEFFPFPWSSERKSAPEKPEQMYIKVATWKVKTQEQAAGIHPTFASMRNETKCDLITNTLTTPTAPSF